MRARISDHLGSEITVEVGSVQFGVGRNISTPVGMSSKREASAPNVGQIGCTKLMDSTSPLIYQEALRGVACKAQVDLVETHEEQLETYLSLTLENCMISSYSASSGGDRPSESFSLNFTKIEYKYTPFDDKHKAGTPVPVTYDVTTATK